jgi:hypothetical protein
MNLLLPLLITPPTFIRLYTGIQEGTYYFWTHFSRGFISRDSITQKINIGLILVLLVLAHWEKY